MIPFIKPQLGQEEIDAVVAVMQSGMIAQASNVAEFEKEFAAYCDVEHAVAVNSGTAAIHTMLAALGVGPGDEVITTPFTFIATATPIAMCGATPVFVDIDPNTYNLDPAKVEAAITDKTKAIVAVHIFGQVPNWDALQQIATKHGVHLVEDAAQAVGAKWKGKRAGSLGEAGAFSTYATKNMSTGEGGLVTTNNAEIADFARRFRHHGQPLGTRYTYEHLGYNYRMTDISAAIGREQLKKLDGWNARRREVGKAYNEAFKDLDAVSVFADQDAEHVYHLYSMRVHSDRDQFQNVLKDNEVSSGVYYPIPLYRTKVFQTDQNVAEQFPVCEQVCSEILSIPCHPALTDDQVERVIKGVQQAAQG